MRQANLQSPCCTQPASQTSPLARKEDWDPKGDLLRKGEMQIRDLDSILGPMGFHRDKVILAQDVVRTGNATGPRHPGETEAQHVRMRGQVQKTPKMVESTGILTHKGISRIPGRKSQTKQALWTRIQQRLQHPPISRQCHKQMELSNFTLLLWDNLQMGRQGAVTNKELCLLIIRVGEVLSDWWEK